MVNGQGVSLLPLFHWWTNRSGARPFIAWVHITGSIVGTNGFNWVVRATIEDTGYKSRGEEGNGEAGGGDKRILLRTPPTWDRVEFERLLAQRQDLKDQRAWAESQNSQAGSLAKTSSNWHGRARAVAQAEAHAGEKQAQGEMQDLDKQIKDIESKLGSYPSKDHYEVDCFALDTGQTLKGLPVYEHGMSWQ